MLPAPSAFAALRDDRGVVDAGAYAGVLTLAALVAVITGVSLLLRV